jgi:acetyl esterase/lipase
VIVKDGKAKLLSMTTSITPPPFDPELAIARDRILSVVSTTLDPAMLPLIRQDQDAQAPSLDALRRKGTFTVEQRFAPRSDGMEIELLIARPVNSAQALPAIYYVHGGGMIMGNNRIGVDEPLEWAARLGFVVVSVEYRLAPEHPYPAGIDDVYAGFEWLAKNAEDIGVDSDRIIAVGSSSGAGLVAALGLLARDRKGPPLAGQMLLAPMLDDRNDSVSSRQMQGLDLWDQASNGIGWTSLLGSRRGTADVSPYAAPARATDLSNLPPTYIEVGSAETFRDEDVAFASRIWTAGGQAELHVWPGGFHGFRLLAPQATISKDAQKAKLAWLRRILG